MMRMFAFMLVLLVRMSAARLPMIQNKAALRCANKNPFISHLRAHRVELLAKPLITDSVCAFEFQTFGTCCNTEDIVKMGKVKKAALMKDVAFINEEYKRFNGVLSEAYKLLLKTAMTPAPNGNPRWNRFIASAKQALNDEVIAQYFSNYMNAGLDAEKFAKANTKCWEMQAEARQ